MKRQVGSLLVAFLLSTTATSSHALSLKESFEAAYQNNPALNAERSRLKATNEGASQAFSGWLPSASFDYSRGPLSRKFGANPETDDISDSKVLSFTQPIFSGGRTIYSMKKADNNIASARANLVRVEQDTLFNVVVAYMNVAREREVLQLNINNENVLKKHLLVTKERFKLGEVTRTDVAQAEARLSLAVAERASAEGKLEIARANFKRITGVTEEGAVISEKPGGLPSTLEELATAALNNHPAVKGAIHEEQAAKEEVKIRRANILPSVDVRGTIRHEEGTSFAGNNKFEEESLTFNVSVPLYQSGAEYSQVRQAKQDVRRKESDRESIENSIEEFSTQVWQDYIVSKATIHSTRDAVKAAQIALEGVIQEAQVGSRTTLDVLDAEQELFKAKVDMVRAQRNEMVSIYNIKSAMGELTAENLSLEVERFDPEEHYDKVKYRVAGF